MRIKLNQRVTEVTGIYPVKTKTIDFDGERVHIIHRATDLEGANGIGCDEMFTTYNIRLSKESPHIGNVRKEDIEKLIQDGLEKGYIDFDSIGTITEVHNVKDIPENIPYSYSTFPIWNGDTPFFGEEDF